MKRKEKLNRMFSESFKMEKVAMIQKGSVAVKDLSKMYDVSEVAIYKWIKKYSKLPPGERMVVEKESEATRTLALMKKVAELEKIIGQQQVEILFKDCIIECGSEMIGEDLTKKHLSHQLK